MRLVLWLAIGLTALGVAAGQELSAQGDPTIYIVTYLEAESSSRQQVAAALTRLAEAGRADGAVRFETLRNTAEPNQFMLLEVWPDQKALDAHRAAAHTTRFREQVAPLLLAPADERLCVATLVAPAAPGRATAYVVTHVDVPGTNRESALRFLTTLAQRSRMDAGNLRFDVVHQRERTNHFTVIEAWSDRTTNVAHQHADHTRAFRGAITPLLGALYDQRWYAPL